MLLEVNRSGFTLRIRSLPGWPQKAMKFTSEEGMSLCSYTATAAPPIRHRLVGGSDARTTMGGEEAALIRVWREQNVQMKSQRSIGVITEDPQHRRAHVAKSPTGQAQFLRPVRHKCSRASQRQRQTAAKSTTFMTGIRAFMKACAILWQKLYARFSGHPFDQGNRALSSRVATTLDVPDCVSMKTGRLGQVPNRSTAAPPEFVRLWQPAAPMTHVTKPKPASPCPRINGGIQ
jgi:hypothetical protein